MTSSEKLVADLLAANTDLLRSQDAFDIAKAAVIALGPGKHSDDLGNTINVVAAAEPGQPTITYQLATDDEERARAIAGDSFAKLFDRVVTYNPCAGFADVAPKLLTPAKARDLTALCTVTKPGSKPRAAYLTGLPK